MIGPCDSSAYLQRVACVDTEENPQDLCFFRACPYAFEVVVLLVLAKAALQTARPFLGDGSGHLSTLLLMFCGPTLSFKVRADAVLGNEVPVLVGRIDRIAAHDLCLYVSELLCPEYRIDQSVPFVKGIKTKMLNKTDPIYLELVHLGPKLYRFYFFAPHYRPDVRAIQAYDTILGLDVLVKIGILLLEYLLGRGPAPMIIGGKGDSAPILQSIHYTVELGE